MWLERKNNRPGRPLRDAGEGAEVSEGIGGTQGGVSPLKVIPAPSEKFQGAAEGLVIVNHLQADSEGWVHAGMVNSVLQLGVEISFPSESMPRLANWHHFGPRGSYVTALEPFSGSIFGKQSDLHPNADQWIEPGETKHYALRLAVHSDLNGLARIQSYDGPLGDRN